PEKHAILELAGAAFSLETRSNLGLHAVVPVPWLPGRVWNEETRKWHYSTPAQGEHIESLLRATVGEPNKEAVARAMQVFIDWVNEVGKDSEIVFWSKPSNFDNPFFNSYCEELGLKSPFHYRRIVDQRSFMRGIEWLHGVSTPDEYTESKSAHRALQDC